MKDPKTYKPKRLISGRVIGKTGPYVAVPDKGYKDGPIVVKLYKPHSKKENTLVLEQMTIKNWHKAAAFRRFHDQFGGGTYVLGYFPWTPGKDDCEQLAISV